MARTYNLSPAPSGTTPADYERIRGTSYYRLKDDPSVVISNGSMSNVRARELGYDGRGERQSVRRLDSYTQQLKSAKEAGMNEKEFEKQRNDIFKTDKVNDVSPTGAFAKFLVAIGLRDPDATYNVGETPKKKR
jgi:hypothetical protein